MNFYKDKAVLITGASSGIGRELALQLSALGAKLILTARSAEKLEEVKKCCKKSGAICKVFPADLYKEVDRADLIIFALKTYGHLDIFISNAGVSQRSAAIETPMDIDRQLMEINYFSSIDLTKRLLPHFKEKGSGQIIVLSSMAGLMGFPQRTAYAAAKHALMGFYETLQVEHELPNFHITIASPGRVKTDISLSSFTADGRPHGKMDKGQEEGIAVSICAGKILKAASKYRKHILIARGEKLLWWIRWFCASLYYRIARKAGKK